MPTNMNQEGLPKAQIMNITPNIINGARHA
jgi:hypothetical protein